MTATEEFPLPTLDEQLGLLRATGNQFDPEEREARWLALSGVTLQGDETREPVLYDAGVVPTIPEMVVPSNNMRHALEVVRPGLQTSASAGAFLLRTFAHDGLIVGFSGYGTGTEKGGRRYEYEDEYEGLLELFAAFHDAEMPVGQVVDGGTGFGVPGLSGVVAEQEGITTIGYTPARSLRGIARRDTSVIIGEEFGDEAIALGSTPDILIAMGGGPNAEKEVEAALDAGSLVMLLTLRDYPPSSIAYMTDRHEGAREAKEKERLFVCESIDEARVVIGGLNAGQLRASRFDIRLHILQRALHKTV
jgi:hypothetical protein